MSGITIELRNYEGVMRGLKECKRDLAKKARKALVQVGTRGAKTAAQQEVRKVYNVTVSDVNSRFHYKESGGVTLEGIRIPTYQLEWKQDRSFTPGHASFKMKPRSRPSGRGAYAVTFSPLKGAVSSVGSTSGFPVFVQSANGSPVLPWNRLQAKTWLNGGRLPIDTIPTHLSIPQMIDNEKVNPNIEKEIVRRLEKAL